MKYSSFFAPSMYKIYDIPWWYTIFMVSRMSSQASLLYILGNQRFLTDINSNLENCFGCIYTGPVLKNILKS